MFRSAVLKGFSLVIDSVMLSEALLVPVIFAFMSTMTTNTIYSSPTFPVESAGALLRHPIERKYLLLERNPDYIGNTKAKHELEYPGGKFEDADLDAHKCASRETWEETSLVVPIEQLHTGIAFKTYNPESKKWVFLIETTLTHEQVKLVDALNIKLAESVTADPKSATAISLKWVSEDDLRKLTEGNTPDGSLPLRGFNRIVLRAYFSAK